MITKFDSSYVGSIDLENPGYTGTPINSRRYSSAELAAVMHKTETYAQHLDKLGYHAFWMAEHHFQPEGTECIPNLLMMGVHLANITKHLKIACGFNVTPMWHPLRLAEDYAMAELLSRGRVIFGVARGYHTREVEVFGSPLRDQDANRELFEEQVDIIFKAFSEERFSYQGKFYTIPPADLPYRGYVCKDITLVPQPQRRPVECWQPIQSGTDRAFDFMAKYGISGVIGGGSAEGGAVERHMKGFQAAYARRGVELALGERLAIGFQFCIAESREAAMRKAGKYYEENMKMFGELRLVRALTDEQIAAMRHPEQAAGIKLPTIEDAVAAGGFLAGTPADIIETLKKMEARYPGLDRVICTMPLGTPLATALEQLERFATEVMPAFQSKKAAAAD
jgi:alkanesulfonate monooxygenase SsuD/methylene tetrahydromethanopterin reductase-like flavin-dependent oxidoreductase (luciferase family)